MPYLNFLCIVLWCHVCMPSHAPMLPPITANISNVASDIRHLPFIDAEQEEGYDVDEYEINDVSLHRFKILCCEFYDCTYFFTYHERYDDTTLYLVHRRNKRVAQLGSHTVFHPETAELKIRR